MDNLAILKTVNLDGISILNKEFDQQLQVWDETNFKFNYVAAKRAAFNKHDFTEYFQKLIDQIVNEIGIMYENIQIQWVHAGQHVVHKDLERLSNITIPVVPVLDPVAFYSDDAKPKTKLGPPTKMPEQVSFYSDKNPMLLNVQKYHGVFCGINRPNNRALLQLGWDTVTFQEIMSIKPNIWEIVSERGLANS